MAGNFNFNTFANLAPPWSLPNLDANFAIVEAGLNNRMVSPKDPRFGAKGDGVTNDTAALQAWLIYLAGVGGTGILPPGNYLSSQLDMRDLPYVNIFGCGMGASVITSIGAVNPLLIIGGQPANGPRNFGCEISNLKLNDGGAALSLLTVQGMDSWAFRNVWLEAGPTVVTNTSINSALIGRFEGCWWRGGTQIGIDIFDQPGSFANTPSQVLTFRNCRINSAGVRGMRATRVTDLVIDDSVFEGNGSANNTGNGGLYITDWSPDGVGLGASVNRTWFEGNTGTDIALGDTTFSGGIILRDILSFGGTRNYGLYVPAPGGGRRAPVYGYTSSFLNALVADINTGTGVGAYFDNCLAILQTLSATTTAYPEPAGGTISRASSQYLGLGTSGLTGATPTIGQGESFNLTQGGATNVTAILGGAPGQVINIVALDALSTLIDSAGFRLMPAGNHNLLLNEAVVLRCVTANNWRLIGKNY